MLYTLHVYRQRGCCVCNSPFAMKIDFDLIRFQMMRDKDA